MNDVQQERPLVERFRALLALIAGLLAAGGACANPTEGERPPFPVPSSVFMQAGASEDARALVAGAAYDTRWHRPLPWAHASSYVELSVGRWVGDRDPEGRSSAWVTQVGWTPVLRLQPPNWHGWYAEAGIGVNLLAPVYRSRDKRFSTVLNFGDHIALGRRFGETRRHEIALRFQHFSNAGIRRPNPGENFIQLRYSRRL